MQKIARRLPKDYLFVMLEAINEGISDTESLEGGTR